jgi:hypothetical protein
MRRGNYNCVTFQKDLDTFGDVTFTAGGHGAQVHFDASLDCRFFGEGDRWVTVGKEYTVY